MFDAMLFLDMVLFDERESQMPPLLYVILFPWMLLSEDILSQMPKKNSLISRFLIVTLLLPVRSIPFEFQTCVPWTAWPAPSTTILSF